MKKRYARILAATLSAAMVFTSAPVNFTGIDLGVIEAEAAVTKTDYATTAAAKQEIEAILNTIDWSVALGDIDTDSATTIEGLVTTEKTDLLESKGFDNVVFTAIAPTTGSEDTIGNYTFGVKVDWNKTNSTKETVTCANRTLKITKNPMTPGDDTFSNEPVTAKYKIGTASITDDDRTDLVIAALKDIKNSAGTIVAPDVTGPGSNASNVSGYKVDANSVKALKEANVVGTKVELVFRKVLNDCDEVDYTTSSAFVSQGGPDGYFEKKITVELVGNTTTITNPVPGDISYAFGADKVTLSSTTNTNYVVTGYRNTDLANVAEGTLNVYLETKTAYKASEYDYNAMLNTLQTGADSGLNAWKSTWTYDTTSGKFSVCMPMPAVAAKQLYIKDIVWPTKLKDGSLKVPYMADLSKVELEETATTKAGLGKFVLAHYTTSVATANADTVADPSYKKYCIKFVPTTGKVEVVNPAAGDVNRYGATDIVKESNGAAVDAVAAEVTIVKKDCLELTCTKSVIANKDISVKYVAADDDVKFGTKYGDLSVSFPVASATAGSYTLKDAKATDELKIGKNTVTYVYKVSDKDRYEIEGGVDSKEVSFDVVVNAPEVKVNIASSTGKNYVKVGEATPYTLTASLAVDKQRVANSPLNATTDLKEKSYQWYSKSKGAIYGATSKSYTVSVTDALTDSFYCVIKPETATGLAAAKKTIYDSLIGTNSITSDDFKVSVAKMQVTNETDISASDIKYGAISQVLSAKLTPATGYTVKSVTWTLTNKDTKESKAIEGKITSNNTISADVPKDTEVGKYVISAEVVAASATEADDTVIIDFPFEIKKQTTLPTSVRDLLAKIDVAAGDKEVAYGTKVKDIKLVIPEGSEKYGTFEWLNGDEVVSSDTKDYVVRFVASEFAKKNYTTWDTVAGAVKVKGTQDYNIKGIKATKKAALVITANDVTVDLNGTLPSATYTATGLVASDTVRNLGVEVTVSIDKTKVDLTKVGTYAGAVTVTAKFDGKTNENIELDNYTVKVVAGNVIVKAATVAPSVKPTPAPVKQATAAAPKAAKAKATVKVGKKYTLKLKYAAGKKATVKKVTWKSSKKSVATVSSKGKVTAKKAGKATITATITFKDGSKKKVKFTVTVK